jgi:hypothetical protein
MSAAGEAEDAFASRAQPRRAARVCERGRRPTRDSHAPRTMTEGARRARRHAIAPAADMTLLHAADHRAEAAG